MDIFTLYVGQGELAAVRSGGEAIIIDAHMPNNDEVTQKQIEQTLSIYLKNVTVRGLILTGLDKDHACPAGVDSILTHQEPDWVMYPTCYKETEAASEVFEIIERHKRRRKNTNRPLVRHSVRLDKVDSRLLDYLGLSDNFSLELFSPHPDDMDNSNNSSIVLKLTGLDSSGFTYLITGDTETERWDTINIFFGNNLKSDVMSAPHHGALTGVNPKTLLLVDPNTVLISAGVNSQYGHPTPKAVKLYQSVAKHVFTTNAKETGNCLFTKKENNDFDTKLIEHPDAE